MFTTSARTALRLAGRILDVVLPQRCPACNSQVETRGGLCVPCWCALSFIGPPLCLCCGLPFELDIGGDALCGDCMTERPSFGRARAVMVYNDASRPLVLGLKYADQTYAAAVYGSWLVRAGADLLADATLVTPVPLHRWRLLWRRYNQSALLAASVCRLTGLLHLPDLLERHRPTPVQGGLNRKDRHRNVAGAFRVRPSRAARVREANIVLIDDVLTTGATLAECADVLMQAGAARVDVLTLARVTKSL
ncbi:MAG: ComF family protein [Rhodospirillaceae bacterium]